MIIRLLIFITLLSTITGCRILERGNTDRDFYGKKCAYRMYDADENSGCPYKLSPPSYGRNNSN